MQWVPGLSRGCNGRGVAFTTTPHLVPRLKKDYSYTSIPSLCLNWSDLGELYLFLPGCSSGPNVVSPMIPAVLCNKHVLKLGCSSVPKTPQSYKQEPRPDFALPYFNKPPKSMHCGSSDVFPGLNSASRHGDVTISTLGGSKPSLASTDVCLQPYMMLAVRHVRH